MKTTEVQSSTPAQHTSVLHHNKSPAPSCILETSLFFIPSLQEQDKNDTPRSYYCQIMKHCLCHSSFLPPLCLRRICQLLLGVAVNQKQGKRWRNKGPSPIKQQWKVAWLFLPQRLWSRQLAPGEWGTGWEAWGGGKGQDEFRYEQQGLGIVGRYTMREEGNFNEHSLWVFLSSSKVSRGLDSSPLKALPPGMAHAVHTSSAVQSHTQQAPSKLAWKPGHQKTKERNSQFS